MSNYMGVLLNDDILKSIDKCKTSMDALKVMKSYLDRIVRLNWYDGMTKPWKKKFASLSELIANYVLMGVRNMPAVIFQINREEFFSIAKWPKNKFFDRHGTDWLKRDFIEVCKLILNKVEENRPDNFIDWTLVDSDELMKHLLDKDLEEIVERMLTKFPSWVYNNGSYDIVLVDNATQEVVNADDNRQRREIK